MRTYFYIALLFLLVGIFSCQNQTGGTQIPKESINTTLSVDEFEKKLSSQNVQLVDVRTVGEFSQGHLNGALNIDINSNEFQNQIAKLDKNKPVLVYCLSGGRSVSAANYMASNGFREIYNMEGGTLKWNAANKPLVSASTNDQPLGLSLADFNKLIDTDKLVLVDYNAKWCKPCKKMAPMLDAFVVDREEKIVLIKIDADENKDLLHQKGIQAIPVLELYKDKKLIWKHEGEIDEAELSKEIKL